MGNNNTPNEKYINYLKKEFYDIYTNKPKKFFKTIYNLLVTNNDDERKIKIRAMYVEAFKDILVRDGHKWNEINRQDVIQVLNALKNPDYEFKKLNLELAHKSPLKFEYKGKEYTYKVMSEDEYDKLVKDMRRKKLV